jgi:hypothetical protein
MKIYTISDDNIIKDVSLLLRLNADCTRLYWSYSINDIPNDVMGALETVGEYIKPKVRELCGSPKGELTDDEESEMFKLIKENITLKESLGKGVVRRGKQAQEVSEILKSEKSFEKIQAAIESGENVVIF